MVVEDFGESLSDEATVVETAEECVCLRCGYRWINRVERPKACPDCKSRSWDVPDEKVSRET